MLTVLCSDFARDQTIVQISTKFHPNARDVMLKANYREKSGQKQRNGEARRFSRRLQPMSDRPEPTLPNQTDLTYPSTTEPNLTEEKPNLSQPKPKPQPKHKHKHKPQPKREIEI
jgi:outer membrane biosynthesis protein TonB